MTLIDSRTSASPTDTNPSAVSCQPDDAGTRRNPITATWKAEHAIAYADAFAVATAIEFNARLITGDPELRPLEGKRGLSILWLQQRTRR
jgi:hypothetical protein